LIIIKYGLFALISTFLNLFTQYVFLIIFSIDIDNNSTFHNYIILNIAIGCGILVGLISKYFLDKIYIFNHQNKNKSKIKELKTFSLYSFGGFFTTLIFLFFELGADYLFGNNFENAKYIGGAIGLLIGYLIKYHIDKKYVFINVIK
jgi:putative flippase GtrA